MKPWAIVGAGLAGAWWWLWFFHYGAIAFAAYDWPFQIGYMRVVQEALAAHVLPLYRADLAELPWHGYDNRIAEYLYWAHPQTPLGPHMLALTVMSPGAYLMLNLLLFYAAGFAGVVALARRYHLSTVPFLLLLVLLFGNGHLLAHLVAGHAWEGCFVLSWLCYFVFRACEEDRSTRTAIALALVLAALVLQGQMHVLVYCCIFLAVVGVTAPWLACWVAGVALAVGALGAIRLVPIAAVFPFGEAALNAYFPGFDSGQMLLDALVGPQGRHYVEWWEYDAYIGWAALAFLAVFGLGVAWVRDPRHLLLLPAVLVLAIWSTAIPFPGREYGLDFAQWHNLGIPVLSTERMPSRLLLMPLVILSAEACLALQWAIDRHRAWIIVGLVVLALTATGLQQHAEEWRSYLQPGLLGPSNAAAHLLVDPAPLQEYHTNNPFAARPPGHIIYDTARYRRAIYLGTAISFVALLGAAAYCRRNRDVPRHGR